MINKEQKPKNKSFDTLEYGYMTDDWFDKELEKERAWLFYESGIQDMRENKSLIWVYKF